MALDDIDHDRLLRLRLVVARTGEMDLQGWWNTKGLLGRMGKTLYARGFPRTAPFAQGRAVMFVARDRCRELWNPPGCATLWSLPPSVEEAQDDQWQRWLDQPDRWQPFFESLHGVSGDLLNDAKAMSLVADADVGRAREFKRTADGRAVLLSGSRILDDATITDLALGFFRGERGAPAVPYVRLEA
jgi:hypothetical protein